MSYFHDLIIDSAPAFLFLKTTIVKNLKINNSDGWENIIA